MHVWVTKMDSPIAEAKSLYSDRRETMNLADSSNKKESEQIWWPWHRVDLDLWCGTVCSQFAPPATWSQNRRYVHTS